MKSRLRRTVAACIWGAFICTGCGGRTGALDAAAGEDANPTIDAGAASDSATSLSWVDFAVTGCSLIQTTPEMAVDAGPENGLDASVGLDGGMGVVPTCVGEAPLELRFSAVSPTTIETYRWTFGDGETLDAEAPVHIYDSPGLYTVGLTVGGPGGTAQLEKIELVEVRPASLGAVCQMDDQCEPGFTCLCAGDATCAPGLQPGRCTVACDMAAPCTSGACVDLAAAQPADPASWQHATCLPECVDASDCPSGLTCQELPSIDGSWVHACFAPGMLRAMGVSCFDGDGQPDHSACASGYCATLGARGICSTPCTPGAGNCSESSACADFAGTVPSSCLLRCQDAGSCANDPWLACQAPDGPGEMGFTVDEMAAEFGYCAPRSCADANECGLDGVCVGGYCAP